MFTLPVTLTLPAMLARLPTMMLPVIVPLAVMSPSPMLVFGTAPIITFGAVLGLPTTKLLEIYELSLKSIYNVCIALFTVVA